MVCCSNSSILVPDSTVSDYASMPLPCGANANTSIYGIQFDGVSQFLNAGIVPYIQSDGHFIAFYMQALEWGNLNYPFGIFPSNFSLIDAPFTMYNSTDYDAKGLVYPGYLHNSTTYEYEYEKLQLYKFEKVAGETKIKFTVDGVEMSVDEAQMLANSTKDFYIGARHMTDTGTASDFTKMTLVGGYFNGGSGYKEISKETSWDGLDVTGLRKVRTDDGGQTWNDEDNSVSTCTSIWDVFNEGLFFLKEVMLLMSGKIALKKQYTLDCDIKITEKYNLVAGLLWALEHTDVETDQGLEEAKTIWDYIKGMKLPGWFDCGNKGRNWDTIIPEKENICMVNEHIIYYGVGGDTPTTSEEVNQLNQAVDDGGSFTLDTGKTETKFKILMQANKTISKVIDLNADGFAITSEYVYLGQINVLGIDNKYRSYNQYEMNIAIPYTVNHKHVFNIEGSWQE